LPNASPAPPIEPIETPFKLTISRDGSVFLP
jgi:hypothetical protein